MAKLRFIFPTVAVIVLISGCGGSSSGSGSSDSGKDEASAPTKAEFLRSAEAICVQTDKVQDSELEDFRNKYPEADSSAEWNEKAVAAAGLPPVLDEAERLDGLTPPSGDEKEIEAIVVGLEEAVQEGMADPGTMLKKDSAGPFTGVVGLARGYGFKACARPL